MSHTINDNCIGCGACAKACPTGAAEGSAKQLHAINPSLCIDCGACGRVCPTGAIRDEEHHLVATVKKANWVRPNIIAENCYACENCVDACPTNALSMLDDSLPLAENLAVLSAPEKCVSCAWCFDNCQFNAIVMEAGYG